MLLYVFLGCSSLSDLVDQVDPAAQQWCASNRSDVVQEVYDGDTIYLASNAESIRLLGVAAPEIGNPEDGSSSECYGDEATNYLRSIVESESVALQFDVECTDIYNRTLAWVVLQGSDPYIAGEMEAFSVPGLNLEDGTYELLLNELLIRAGYAKVFTGDIAKNIRYSDRIEEAEQAAKDINAGLWSACP